MRLSAHSGLNASPTRQYRMSTLVRDRVQPRRSTWRTRHVCLLMLSAMISAACTDTHPGTAETVVAAVPTVNRHRRACLTSETRDAIYARPGIRFHSGLFYKPRDMALLSPAHRLAPLIVQEVCPTVPAAPPGMHLRLGALRTSDTGTVEAAQPTVYTASTVTTLGGRPAEQVVYLWYYAAPLPGAPAITEPIWRAIRITLDEDGHPIIWESLAPAGPEPAVLLFVSRSLDQAAADAHGPPLPHRRFSIERGVDACPNVVVARILDDGPMPMGPFVYLDAATCSVTTLLCRCMPSQVDLFIEDIYYDLLPLPATSPLTATDPIRLDHALRLPPR